MDEYQSLNHSQWECKYHVIFIPKCRRKVLYGELRRHLGPVLRTLAEQKESKIEEGHLMPDHVHIMISIPSKYAVAHVIGYMKGKRDPHRQDVRRPQAQLRGSALLGARLLRFNRGSGRDGDTRVHPQPGTPGQAERSTHAVEVAARHLQVAHSAARERHTSQPL